MKLKWQEPLGWTVREIILNTFKKNVEKPKTNQNINQNTAVTPIHPTPSHPPHQPHPIRPVKSPITTRKQVAAGVDVLPPWKQGDYEAIYTTVTSITQVGQEQQITGVREVRQGLLGGGGVISLSGVQQIQGAIWETWRMDSVRPG